MLAHALLVGEERASRAMRPHSFELDRHSVAESMDYTVYPIERQVHSFCKAILYLTCPHLIWLTQ
jgi:hypothetical protein